MSVLIEITPLTYTFKSLFSVARRQCFSCRSISFDGNSLLFCWLGIPLGSDSCFGNISSTNVFHCHIRWCICWSWITRSSLGAKSWTIIRTSVRVYLSFQQMKDQISVFLQTQFRNIQHFCQTINSTYTQSLHNAVSTSTVSTYVPACGGIPHQLNHQYSPTNVIFAKYVFFQEPKCAQCGEWVYNSYKFKSVIATLSNKPEVGQ